MIIFSFCFGQVSVSKILNAQVVCFLSIDLIVAIVMCAFINANEMKTIEKSYTYSKKRIHLKLKIAAAAM